MYLYLTKIDTDTYRLDPTPETIALCDFILKNIKFDGLAAGEVYFQEGQLYIDDLPINYIIFEGGESFRTPNAYGDESQSYFFNEVRYIYLEDGFCPKGTILVNDD